MCIQSIADKRHSTYTSQGDLVESKLKILAETVAENTCRMEDTRNMIALIQRDADVVHRDVESEAEVSICLFELALLITHMCISRGLRSSQ